MESVLCCSGMLRRAPTVMESGDGVVLLLSLQHARSSVCRTDPLADQLLWTVDLQVT